MEFGPNLRFETVAEHDVSVSAPLKAQFWSQSHPFRNHTKSNFSCVFYVVIWVWKFILKIEHRGFNGADAVNLLMPLILAVPMMYWVANRNQPFVTFVTGSWLDWTFCSVIFWLMKIAWWIHKPIFIILILKISLDWKVNLIYSNQPARNDTFFFQKWKGLFVWKIALKLCVGKKTKWSINKMVTAVHKITTGKVKKTCY